MKNLKKIQLYTAAFLMIFSMSCSKEGKYNLEETPPLDFRSYYDGLTVTFANATHGATAISWDFGDNSPAVAGDSVAHTYTAIGNYVITMNGSLDGKSYIFHTVLKVDKPSVINLNDGTFDDWNGVTYPDFLLSGKGAVSTAKVDLINGDPGWPFMGFDNALAVKPGYITKEGNTIKMEFGISREVFKINSDAMSFSMSIMNSDWSDVGNVVTPLPAFSEKIVVMMNKSNKK